MDNQKKNRDSNKKENKKSNEVLSGEAAGIEDIQLLSILATKATGKKVKVVEDKNYTPTIEEVSNGTIILLFQPGSDNTIGHFQIMDDTGKFVDTPVFSGENDCAYTIFSKITGKSVKQLRQEIADIYDNNPLQVKQLKQSENFIRDRFPNEYNKILMKGGKVNVEDLIKKLKGYVDKFVEVRGEIDAVKKFFDKKIDLEFACEEYANIAAGSFKLLDKIGLVPKSLTQITGFTDIFSGFLKTGVTWYREGGIKALEKGSELAVLVFIDHVLVPKLALKCGVALAGVGGVVGGGLAGPPGAIAGAAVGKVVGFCLIYGGYHLIGKDYIEKGVQCTVSSLSKNIQKGVKYTVSSFSKNNDKEGTPDEEKTYAGGGNSLLAKGMSESEIIFNLKVIIAASRLMHQRYLHRENIIISKKILNKAAFHSLLVFSNKNINNKDNFNILSFLGVSSPAKQNHLLLCYIRKIRELISITILDPLSEKESKNKDYLLSIRKTIKYLQVESFNIVFTGLQNKSCSTCGDLCLIMMHKILEFSMYNSLSLQKTIDTLFISNKINYKTLGSVSLFKPDKYRHSITGSSPFMMECPRSCVNLD